MQFHIMRVSQAVNTMTEMEMYKPYEVQEYLLTDSSIRNAVVMVNGTKYEVSNPKGLDGFVVKVKYQPDDTETDLVLREWGPHDHVCRNISDGSLQTWIRRTVPLEVTSYVRILKRIACFDPFRSPKYPGKISLTKCLEDRFADKQTAMTPTRALACMFPELVHKQLIVMTDEFNKLFCHREFTVHTSDKASDFILAYAGEQCMMENIDHTNNRKSLANSCMRYDFDHLEVHPVAAYASGDFSIIYITDQNGKIGGRCVVYTGHPCRPQAGPVYGVSEQAIDMIEAELQRIGAEPFENASWIGARLKRIPNGYDNSFIGPYLDLYPQNLTDDGDHLVVCRGGEIDASVYQGLYNDYAAHCCECNEGLHEDEQYYSEDTGNIYCECCFGDQHFYCEYTQEHWLECNGVEVYVVGFSGRYIKQLVYEDHVYNSGEFVKCTDGNWWDVEVTSYCEYEDSYISPRDEEDYFTCDFDGELYPNTLAEHTECGLTVAKCNLDESWQLNKDGVWEKIQEEMEI